MLARRPDRDLPIPAAGSSSCRRPTSPLERNPQPSKGWKKKESDGVGLGILAQLSKARSRGDDATAELANLSAAGEGFPVADFLSCCYLCRKRLHGKDIYMYRGEKAFCSMDCRYQQIVSEEYMEY
ncbi:uncharacterized protein LOC110028739 [Phalaenopsis equestris]|uniref:uncharacterized protein LOC110028739 n=1 Tax=Phalaenopsis equestris TaxID=78828 RepID=UPI0009E5A44E|nr:uncharacterized protein LOC110028739 [Phalaenopsis equestris]